MDNHTKTGLQCQKTPYVFRAEDEVITVFKNVESSESDYDAIIGVCGICGFHNRRPSQVKRHKLSHTSKKPYGCKICFSMFKHKWSAHEHVEVQHRILIIQKNNPIMVPQMNEATSSVKRMPPPQTIGSPTLTESGKKNHLAPFLHEEIF
ncbi:hypothetical protein M514_10636 [Trichuris suis]|uniref:C2H2-type domain-containing protein n=1 Tax=Trichuris suis TaxID=68888 RepID=A0A085LU56_9BILA|nr:hypothetical protein M513_10636 [Trichuris suis]KFD69692.1 hypothetical protein M514_10636 [Trichuris suis]